MEERLTLFYRPQRVELGPGSMGNVRRNLESQNKRNHLVICHEFLGGGEGGTYLRSLILPSIT